MTEAGMNENQRAFKPFLDEVDASVIVPRLVQDATQIRQLSERIKNTTEGLTSLYAKLEGNRLATELPSEVAMPEASGELHILRDSITQLDEDIRKLEDTINYFWGLFG